MCDWRSVLTFDRASTSRLGSAMLSRVAAPSTYLRMASPRAFSTSIAMRADPPKDAPKPRLNPLIGNVAPARKPKVVETEPEPVKAEPPKTESRRAAPTITSDAPPPPPPAANATILSQFATPQKQHAYNAASDGMPGQIDILDIISTKSKTWADSNSIDPTSRPQIRAKAVTGRTIFITSRPSANSSTTPVAAINTLNRMIRNDKVRTKFHSQKFHERKGLKKKRLRSERWRARFKDGFKATVSRVIELKKQGW